MKKTLLFFSILCLILGCKQSSPHIDYLQNAIKAESHFSVDKIKYIVIVPSGGCGGCISDGIKFIRNNIDELNEHKDEIRLIFTANESLKILKNNLGEDVLNSSITYIDKNNDYYTPSNESIYPVVLYVKDKSIKSFQYKSPYDPFSFDNLLKNIRANTSDI